MLNPYFEQRAYPKEHNLYDSLIAESIQIKGTNIYYLPRTMKKLDQIFGEDTLSEFSHAIPLEAYMETVNGPEGDGDIISKFGLEIRDQTTFTVSKKRWEDVVGSLGLTSIAGRPNEGDLIFFQIEDLQRELYEIKFVEHEDPFYQLNHIGMYKLKCEMFVFSNEKFNTGIPMIDSLDNKTAYDGVCYEVIAEDGSSIVQEDGSLILQDDWIMEDAERHYAVNQVFIDKASSLVVNSSAAFGFQ